MQHNTELDRIIFALLFASDEPLSATRIANVLEQEPSEVKASLLRLADTLEADRSSAMLEQVALGYQLATRPEFAKYIARLYSGKRKHRLSHAGLETLAIIAYKQPITRAEIENIRGVGCGGVVTTLMERSLIRIVGKAKVLGGPFLYGTTHEFLEYLGLNDINDLPASEELEALLEKEEYGADTGNGTDIPIGDFLAPLEEEIEMEAEVAGDSAVQQEDFDHAEPSNETIIQQPKETNESPDEEPPDGEKAFTE